MPSRTRAATCATWFLFFAGMGLFFPYNSLYLRESAGLEPLAMGLVWAVVPLVGVVAQPVWGQVADRTGRRSATVVVLLVGSAAAFCVFPTARGAVGLAAVSALLAAFHHPVGPSLASVTLASLAESGRTRSFGLVRVWGTLGFLVSVTTFPLLLAGLEARRGSEAQDAAPLGLLYPAAAACCLAAAVAARGLPRVGGASVRAAPGEWRLLLARGPYRRLLLVAFGAFLFLHGPMIFFPLRVRAWGGDVATLGWTWALMLSLEVPLVLATPIVLRRLDPRALLVAGLVAGGARWATCGVVHDPVVLQLVQVLHGVVVVGVIVGGQLYVEGAVPRQLRSTGQGLFAMVGAGLGSIVSSGVTGQVVAAWGIRPPYLIGGVGALVLAAAVPVLLPRPDAA